MASFFFLAVALVAIASAGAVSLTCGVTEPVQGTNCMCTWRYSPVCGSMGDHVKSFQNDCSAQCAGAAIVTDKVCTKEMKCDCPDCEELWCGSIDNLQRGFRNRCEAACQGAVNVQKGRCIIPIF